MLSIFELSALLLTLSAVPGGARRFRNGIFSTR
ncbi:hypothetical protein J2Z17_004922 [Rhizobium halophytocola]|uniref:Uncharacterized protein n=1 Tax=Rhizobium halophytocola TaxID=735519 RepID=A0ABS4E6A6_9HYPH|nr:hypothetical protein [Rhizobium halophytocola]